MYERDINKMIKYQFKIQYDLIKIATFLIFYGKLRVQNLYFYDRNCTQPVTISF